MNKIFKSIIFTGFLIVSSLTIILSINTNEIFAIEYNTYTNETFGIEFQYPNNWELVTDDIDASGYGYVYFYEYDLDIDVDIDKYDNEDLEDISDLQTFTQQIKEESEGSEVEFKIRQNSTTVSTGNVEMGTFTYEYKDENEYKIRQVWTILADDHGYLIVFEAPLKTFNNPEVSKIREHFVKSIKLVSNDKSSTDISQIDTTDKENQPQQQQPQQQQPQQQQSFSIADELTKLGNLKDQGIITDEEFNQLKKNIIK